MVRRDDWTEEPSGSELAAELLAPEWDRVPSKLELLEAAGFDVEPHQRAILESLSHKVLWLGARQSGKSLTLAVEALHQAMSQPESLSLVVSHTERGAKLVLDHVRVLCRRGQDVTAGMSETATELRLPNGSRILALPASPSVRGHHCDLLMLDEAAYIADEIVAAVIPTAVEARWLWCSTPNTSEGYFAEQWLHGEGWERHRTSWDQVPRLVRDIDRIRATMTARDFAREYALEFLGTGQLAVGPDTLARMDAQALPGVDFTSALELPLAQWLSLTPEGLAQLRDRAHASRIAAANERVRKMIDAAASGPSADFHPTREPRRHLAGAEPVTGVEGLRELNEGLRVEREADRPDW